MAEFDALKVKDQLGRPEDKNITVKRFTETVITEDNVVVLTKKSLGNSWIVGSHRNGIVGTNTNTINGLQQVVGESGRTEVLHRVVNTNGIFREHFRDTYFKDAPNTTANWNTTLHRLSMS